MSVGNEPKLAEGRKSAIDSRPVNSRSRCLSTRNDLIGGEVLISAIENLNDGLASSCHALVLVAEQAQRNLNSRRGY
jgi:hypothetical protein